MSENLKLITDNYIYFHHLDKFIVLPVAPETITDSMGSKFQETNALASTAPVFSYLGSGPRKVGIKLDLHRDLMNDVNTNISNVRPNVVDFKADDYIDVLIRYLQAATLPKFNPWSAGGKTIIPPMVSLRLSNDTFIKGVITSNITINSKKPILSNGKYAQVSINIDITEVDPYDADTVVDLGSFRGITDTIRNGIYNTNSTTISSHTEARNDPKDVLPYLTREQIKQIAR